MHPAIMLPISHQLNDWSTGGVAVGAVGNCGVTGVGGAMDGLVGVTPIETKDGENGSNGKAPAFISTWALTAVREVIAAKHCLQGQQR